MSNKDELKSWCEDINGDIRIENNEDDIGNLRNDLVCSSPPIEVSVSRKHDGLVRIKTQWEEVHLQEGGTIENEDGVLDYKGQLVDGKLDLGPLF